EEHREFGGAVGVVQDQVGKSVAVEVGHQGQIRVRHAREGLRRLEGVVAAAQRDADEAVRLVNLDEVQDAVAVEVSVPNRQSEVGRGHGGLEAAGAVARKQRLAAQQIQIAVAVEVVQHEAGTDRAGAQ